jgi:hypothetical protein
MECLGWMNIAQPLTRVERPRFRRILVQQNSFTQGQGHTNQTWQCTNQCYAPASNSLLLTVLLVLVFHLLIPPLVMFDFMRLYIPVVIKHNTFPNVIGAIYGTHIDIINQVDFASPPRLSRNKTTAPNIAASFLSQCMTLWFYQWSRA